MAGVLDLLDSPIAFHRVFVTLTGKITAAVLLSQALYWHKRTRDGDGWFYKTAEEWEEETGMGRHELDTAKRACKDYLEIEVRGMPARTYYRIREQALTDALSSLPESGKLDCRKAANLAAGKRQTAIHTTEITTENTSIPSGSRRRSPPTTLREFLLQRYGSTEVDLPADDPIYKLSTGGGISKHIIDVHWAVFCEKYLNDRKDKRYKDWTTAFRISVKDNWFKLHYDDPASGQVQLTSQGRIMERRFFERTVT